MKIDDFRAIGSQLQRLSYRGGKSVQKDLVNGKRRRKRSIGYRFVVAATGA